MPGPAPKPAHTRRRRNARPAGTVLPADGTRREAPPLPDRDWLPAVRDWWATVWQSPMASQYLDADVFGLHALAFMLDAALRGGAPASLWTEIRRHEESFGLTPVGRRRLEWIVADPPAAELRALPVRRPDPRRTP